MIQNTSPEEWLRKGSILFESQEFEKALMAYEQALRIFPQSTEAWVKKGECSACFRSTQRSYYILQ
jgi:cytochrome c-type biogenesis protein CcmH/NrfG